VESALPTPTLPAYPQATAVEPTIPPTPVETAYPSPPAVTVVPSPTPAPVLYFLSDRGGQTDLWRLVIGSDTPDQVTNDLIEERWPAFSPDGSRLAYVAFEEAQATVRLLELEQGTSQVVEGSATVELLERLAWLDRDTLLYAIQVPGQGLTLFRVKFPEAIAAPLLLDDLPGGGSVMGWSAAGGKLVLVVGVPGETSGLYQARIEQEDRLVLDSYLGEGYEVNLSLDGNYLAFKAPAYDDDPAGYVLDLVTDEVTSYNEEEPLRRWDHDWAWGPDGVRFAFVRSSWAWTGEDGRPFFVSSEAEPTAIGGSEGLFVADLAGTIEQLTAVGYDTAPVWSLDGRWVAFVGNRDDFERTDIWLLDVATREARVLVGDGGNDWWPLWWPR
jgi:Tol biopolymer transport system component